SASVMDSRSRSAGSRRAVGDPRNARAPSRGGTGVRECRGRAGDLCGSRPVGDRLPHHGPHRSAARTEAVVRMSGVTDLALSVLLGGVLAAGVLCVLAAAPRWHAASLVTRIAPYVRDAVDD